MDEAETVPAFSETWVNLSGLGHRGRFTVRGLAYGPGPTGLDNVVLCIVQNEARLTDNNLVWVTNRVLITRSGLTMTLGRRNYRPVCDTLNAMAEKFDNLYPLHFLAKEWPKEVPWHTP